MKVKLRVYFETVDLEVEVPDNLDEDELHQELSNKVYLEKTDDITNKAKIDYFEEV